MGNKFIDKYRARKDAARTSAPVTQDEPPKDEPKTLEQRVDKVLAASDPVETSAASPLEMTFAKGAVKAARLIGTDVEVAMADGTKVIHQNFTPELFATWKAAPSSAAWYHNNLRTKTKEHPVKNG